MSRNLEALALDYQRRFDKACIEEQEAEFRYHLGASQIGKECLREIWLGYRWVAKIQAKQAVKRLQEEGLEGEELHVAAQGVAARIFSRGTREEPVFYERLKRSGVQFREMQEKLALLWGHYGGTNDGRLFFPEIDEEGLLELKTMNRDNFDKLVKVDKKTKRKAGIKATKPGYYRQVQSYMYELKLKLCLFIVICKDDDRTHFEFIEIDAATGEHMRKRALAVIQSQTPPVRISDDSSYWKCKFCDYHDNCFSGVLSEINCRSCKNASATPEGEWHCTHHNLNIPREWLEKGCDTHNDILRATT